MPQILIAPTAGASTSPAFSNTAKNDISICCNGLQAGETITFQVYDWVNALWADAKNAGVAYQITSDTNFLDMFLGAQTFRVIKSVTANSVGVGVNSDIKIGGLTPL